MSDKDELLGQLRDVELPDVAGTIAPGWWLLILLLSLFLFAALMFNRRRQARLWQRQAKVELQKIRDQLDHEPSVSLLSQCSQLARQVVLAVDKREHVAALHGEVWLEKLDDICARPEFTQGIGRLLLDQPYQRQPIVARQDLTALISSIDVLINSAVRYKPQVDSAGTDSSNSSSSETSKPARSTP